MTYGDRAFILSIVISGRISSPAIRSIRDGSFNIDDAAIQGRSVNEGLERRSGLPQRLRDAVEFAFVEIVASDECLDFAGLRINGDQRP